MPFTIVLFSTRLHSVSPTHFEKHYETKHVPLLKRLAGDLFPTSHIRHYIARPSPSEIPSTTTTTEQYPATVLVGTQADFPYDAYAEITFSDKPAFEAFMGHMSSNEAVEAMREDEKGFLVSELTRVVVLGDVRCTSKE